MLDANKYLSLEPKVPFQIFNLRLAGARSYFFSVACLHHIKIWPLVFLKIILIWLILTEGFLIALTFLKLNLADNNLQLGVYFAKKNELKDNHRKHKMRLVKYLKFLALKTQNSFPPLQCTNLDLYDYEKYVLENCGFEHLCIYL